MGFGYVDSKYIDFAVGQVESRLRNMTNRAGVNFKDFIDLVDGGMAALNTQMDPTVRSLIYPTASDRVSGNFGGKKVWQRGGEYTNNRPQRGSGGGWLLPLHHNGIGLGFTAEALKTMTLDRFESELKSTVQAIARGQRADVLARLFSNAEFPLDDDGVGATPGFAGSGTGSNVYTGDLPNGVTTLNMYSRVAEAGLDAEIKRVQRVLEFYHSGEFDLLSSAEGVALVTALPGFVPAGSALVRPGVGTAEALVDPTRYVGVLNNTIRVLKPDHQLTGPAMAIFKSYGFEVSENPLAWRYSEMFGRDAIVEDRDLFPLANAQISQYYGVGVNNRTGAALISVAGSGSYTAPTIEW